MPIWNLETGCERPVSPTNGAHVGKPAISIPEIIERVRILGARVEERPKGYAVYPPDRNRPPAFLPDSLGKGRDITEIVRVLRRSGLDITDPINKPKEPEVDRKITPADLPERLRNGVLPAAVIEKNAVRVAPPTPDLADQIETLFELLQAAEKANAELAGRVDELERKDRATMRQLQLLEDQRTGDLDRLDLAERRIVDGVRVLEGRIEALESGGAPKTKAQRTREAVLAFFETLPGVKMSPQLVAANISETLPEGLGSTDVAGACADLARAGKLKGGGHKGTGQPQATRGIYWLEVTPND